MLKDGNGFLSVSNDNPTSGYSLWEASIGTLNWGYYNLDLIDTIIDGHMPEHVRLQSNPSRFTRRMRIPCRVEIIVRTDDILTIMLTDGLTDVVDLNLEKPNPYEA